MRVELKSCTLADKVPCVIMVGMTEMRWLSVRCSGIQEVLGS